MDLFRTICAVLIVVTIPPAVAYWYVVHPFPGFWRRFGPEKSLVILMAALFACMFGLFLVRDALVGRDLGTSWILLVVGVLLYVMVLPTALAVRKHLSFGILAGMPEMSADDPGKLLTEGVYSRMRHPRYATVIVGTIGFALIANHVGAYVVTALCVLAIYPIILMEERELRQRFGAEYDEYSKRVPRFALGLGHRGGHGGGPDPHADSAQP